ncbi:hypothetical protein [Aporhodopirellula aestuarii]|uniref:Uncharacterized protein n=1 Tax=Aporhodopirellula aestuarii TaxID=2950107 RepID=A0ABT0U0H3_9BACT|nr:hypothetical protein [Aporhodopirellula aestuarii]MCM2370378.1 hypothetical protein [Aporhodopirellula aestuarii]
MTEVVVLACSEALQRSVGAAIVDYLSYERALEDGLSELAVPQYKTVAKNAFVVGYQLLFLPHYNGGLLPDFRFGEASQLSMRHVLAIASVVAMSEFQFPFPLRAERREELETKTSGMNVNRDLAADEWTCSAELFYQRLTYSNQETTRLLKNTLEENWSPRKIKRAKSRLFDFVAPVDVHESYRRHWELTAKILGGTPENLVFGLACRHAYAPDVETWDRYEATAM